MLFKLAAVLLVLARLAPEAMSLPVNSTSCAYERFDCVSDTSFWNDAEMQCPQGTHCEDMADRDESPCVNDLPANACPQSEDDEQEEADDEDLEPSMSILPIAEPSISVQLANAWANHNRPEAHSVIPNAQPTQTQPQTVAAAAAVVTPVVTPVLPVPVETTSQLVQLTTAVEPVTAPVPAAPAPAGDVFGSTEFTAGSASYQDPVDAPGACGLTIGNPTQYHVALGESNSSTSTPEVCLPGLFVAHAKWDSYGGDPTNGPSSPLCIEKKTITVACAYTVQARRAINGC